MTKLPKTMIGALLGLFLGQNPGILSSMGGVRAATKLLPKQKTAEDFERIAAAAAKRSRRAERNARIVARGGYGDNRERPIIKVDTAPQREEVTA